MNCRITVAATLLLCCACAKKHQSQQMPPETVEVAFPTVDSITVTEPYPAQLGADKALEVVARVNGYITGKYFDDGDYVKEGQVLFTIEDSNYSDRLQQAQAQLATARATADYAAKQYTAMEKALQSQAVSQMDVVKAQSAMNEAEASIKTAEASVRSASTSLGYCTVRALAPGHAAAPPVTVGQYVAGEASPVLLTTVYDDRTVSANFAIEEARFQQIINSRAHESLPMDSICLTFNDTLPHRYHGYLEYVAPDVNTSTGTLKLRVKVNNPYGELKAGMFATVHLPVAVLNEAILVNDAAIQTDQLGPYLMVVNDSNRVEHRAIVTGDLYHDSLRVVASGLTPRDRYVTRALLKVKEGMEVKPIVAK